MAQNPTQRTTGATRLKGPHIVTLRGAGSKGKDYYFGGVSPTGVGLDVGFSVQVPTGQVANMLQFEQPDSGNATGNPPVPGQSTVLGGFDAAMGLMLTPNISQRIAKVTLTAAQIISLHTSPVSLVAAPAAGQLIMVDHCLIQFAYNSVQFTGGGAVAPVYHSTTTPLTTGSLPASVIQAAASSYTQLGVQTQANGATLATATGIDLYAATANFAAGNSTLIVDLFYWLVTVG